MWHLLGDANAFQNQKFFSDSADILKKVHQEQGFYFKSELLLINAINPFNANDFFLYLMQTWESLLFSDISKEYRKRPTAWNGLNVYRSSTEQKTSWVSKKQPKNKLRPCDPFYDTALSIPTESIRTPEVLRCFQRVQKEATIWNRLSENTVCYKSVTLQKIPLWCFILR